MANNWNAIVYDHNQRVSMGERATNVGAASVQNSAGSEASRADSAPAPAAAAATTGAPPGGGVVGTNLQVAGVDEADDVKISADAIFIADNQSSQGSVDIAIVAASPLAYAGHIVVPGLTAPQLYAEGQSLIVTGVVYGAAAGDPYQSFQVTAYDVSDLAAPKLRSSISFGGSPVDSRMVNGKLVVVLSTAFVQDEPAPFPSEDDLPGGFDAFIGRVQAGSTFHVTADKIGDINCRSVVRLPAALASFQYQHVVSYDVASGAVVDDLAIPGDDSELYMTETSLYSIGALQQPTVWTEPGSAMTAGGAIVAPDSWLSIKKVAFDAATGKLTPVAIGEVPGHSKQFDASWAFHEITAGDSQLLAVVTTTGALTGISGSDTATNQLVVLKPAAGLLTPVATLAGFGAAEDVRAVNYVGDKAYVVTFKRTDPLFVIDLKDPLAPRVDGQLEIPGFSMYLQPDGPGRLIGLGYEATDSGEPDINRAFFQGLLLQLFDTSQPSAPTRLAFTDLGMRGSYSEATQNHHAFYYDGPNAVVAVPVALFDDGVGAAPPVTAAGQPVPLPVPVGLPSGQQAHYNREFTGAVFYAIGGSELTEVKRVTHFDLLPATCQVDITPINSWTTPITSNPELRRIFRIGSVIYTVSNFAVKTVDATTYADMAAVSIPGRDCVAKSTYNGNE